MIIEWLKIDVPLELHDKYLQKDQEIWTNFLATCPGFLGKEVWINPQKPTEIILVIRWASREQWDAVLKEKLAEIEQIFDQSIGTYYPIIELTDYQVK